MRVTEKLFMELFNYLNDGQELPYKGRKLKLLRDFANRSVIKGKNILYKEKKEVKIIVPKEKVYEIVKQAYHSQDGGFIGKEKLYKLLHKLYYGITYRDVLHALNTDETYQIHRLPRKRRILHPIIAKKPNERWQIDFIDMRQNKGPIREVKSLESQNRRYKYVLTIIDVFSKFARVIPVKSREFKPNNKGWADVLNKLDKIFKKKKPKIIQADNEFNNQYVFNLLNSHKIKPVISRPYHPFSNAHVERFNRTLKGMIYKYMDHYHTKNWIDYLPQAINTYNNTYHSTIKMTPLEAIESKNRDKVKKALDLYVSKTVSKDTIKPLQRGQKVRILIEKIGKGVKKFTKNWSTSVYTVIMGKKKYTLQNQEGKTLAREYFPDELLPIEE